MPLKVAVVGTGSIGMRHLKVLKQFKEIESFAIPKRKHRIEELRGNEFCAFSSIQEAAKQGVNLAIIATDTSRHILDAMEALNYNMDLLVEKPLGTSATSCLPLYRLANERGKNVFVGCVLRFTESLNIFRELLKKIGWVHSVRIECQSYLPDWRPQRNYLESYSARKGEGGVLLDLIHEIDYATWIFGWPKSLQARLKNFGRLNIDVEELAELWWETDSGTCISLCLDYLSRPPRRKMVALGSDGTLAWDGIVWQVTLELVGESPQVFTFPKDREKMYLEQAKAFLFDASSDQLTSAGEGVRALSLCDAARLASQSQKTEAIHYLV